MKSYLFSLLLFTSFHSPLPEWKTLKTSDYSIKYAEDWVLNEDGQSGTKFILFGPVVTGQFFRNNVNLIVQDLAGQNVDLQQYVDISTEQIKNFLGPTSILSSRTSGSRHEIIYEGVQGQYTLKWKQYYWVQNEKAYVLTYTSDKNSYEPSIPRATEIMNSFKIGGK